MKITIVGPTNPYKGGVAQHTTSLARRLDAAGHDVDLLSWSAQYPRRLYPGVLELADPASEPAFPGTRRLLRWYDPLSWWRAGSRARRRADLVVVSLVNGLQVPAYATLAFRQRRAGARVVAVCHNVDPHESDPVQRRLIAAFLRSVDGALVHSASEAELVRETGVDRVEVAIIPFHFPAASRAGALAPVEDPPTGSVITFGLVRPYKGVEVLIDALARTTRPIRAVVAGEFWTPVDALTDRADGAGVADRIEFRDGYVAADDVMSLLRAHDALVLPYVSGTGSQQPRIAHLAGLPVVATRVGSFPAQIRDGVDGLLVDPSSPGQLAAALDSLYDDGRLRAMRRAVVPPDEEQEWQDYLGHLLAL
jgi:glycosyltransferase involved in cell wall biosynthesis